MCKSEIQESLLYPFSGLQYPTHHHALYILLPNWIFNLPLSISNPTKASYYELTPGILELPISLLERERDKKEREPEIGEIFILKELVHEITEAGKSNICFVDWRPKEEPMLQFNSESLSGGRISSCLGEASLFMLFSPSPDWMRLSHI